MQQSISATDGAKLVSLPPCTYPHPELFIPALISWGADVNARDHSGQSLILEAVRNQHSAAVRILLHHGTLVGNPGDTVMTPLQVGIVNNAYDSVSELLTRRFNHAALDKTGMSVLHYAALFADVPMLSLLTRARMGGLNLGLRDEQGHTATELARQRTERQRAEMETKEAELEPIYWETAFAELLASVNMPRNSKMSMASRIFGSENSDSDDTTSFNSATEYLDELGFV